MMIRWAFVITVALSAPALAQGQAPLPPGPGKEIVETVCVACHSLERVSNAGYSLAGWRTDIARMVKVGARLEPDQVETAASPA